MGKVVGGAAGSLAVLLVAGLGYLWADAADVVPGALTARPLPPQRQAAEPVTAVVPSAPGPLPDLSAAPGPAPVAPAELAARLGPALTDPALGPAVSASVRDLATGELLLSSEGGSPRVPASTAKVLTAAVALQTLGADTELRTSTSWLSAAERGADRPAVVLTGGGDVLLAAGQGDPSAVVGHAGLADLADRTARALLAGAEQGRPSLPPGLDVVVDDSLLGADQQLARGAGDNRFSAPPASLAVEAGVLGTGPRDADPAATAGAVFTAALEAALARLQPRGAPVVDDVTVSSAGPPPVGRSLAEVRSAPVSEVLAHLLATSDNATADAVAGLVAAEAGRPTTLSSAGQVVAELAAVTGSFDAGQAILSDGSGLSAGSRVSADALTAVLAAAAAAPEGDPLRLLPGLLPVAGLEGTVQDRFDGGGSAAAARGVSRSKTGTLTGVTTLAGVVTTADGRGVAYALLADAVPPTGTEPARDAVDRALAAIASCC